MNYKVCSEYNLKFGVINFEKLLKVVKKDGQKYCTLVDYFSISGAIKFFITCIKYNIKPIIGCEIFLYYNYIINGNITLYVKNKIGYRNLCRILNKSWEYYSKKNVLIFKFKWFNSSNVKGIFFLSGSDSGILKNIIYKSNFIIKCIVLSLINKLKFFYFEAQRNTKISYYFTDRFIILSYLLGIPMVATCIVRFVDRFDFYSYIYKYCILNKKYISECSFLRSFFDNFSFISKKKFISVFSDIPFTLLNLKNLSIKCNFNIFDLKVNSRITNLDFKLFSILSYRFRKFFKYNFFIYYIRLLSELKVIFLMNYSKYFLIVYKILCWSRFNDIQIGPGRGSCSSSLISYILRITQVDPISYKLIFERFLNFEMDTYPDFDIDICQFSRDKVVKYVKDSFRINKVVNIVTYNRFSPKSSIRDTGRILGIRYNYVDNLSTYFSDYNKNDKSISNILSNNRDISFLNNNLSKKILSCALKVEGLVKNIGIHAAGIVILEGKNFLPLFYIRKNNIFVTQYDKQDIEKLKIIKIDLLGLTALSLIYIIKKKSNINANFFELPLNSRGMYSLINTGYTCGIFQLEGTGLKRLLYRININCFKDIVDIISLYRPGPINLISEYILRKRKKVLVSDFNDKGIDYILNDTNGIIIYQEQVLEILKKIFNYSYNRADRFRKNLAKGSELYITLEKKYFLSCNVFSKNKSILIFNLLSKSIGYSFNKSHATSYSLITYYMLWLKYNFFTCFIVNCINCYYNNPIKIEGLINESRRKKVLVLSVEINLSYYNFFILSKNCIIFGFNVIKGLGISSFNEILRARQIRKFYNFRDFYLRINKRLVNYRVIKSLIFLGAFNNLTKCKEKLFFELDKYFNKLEQFVDDANLICTCRLNKYCYLIMEKKLLGFFFSINPLILFKRFDIFFSPVFYGIVISVKEFSNYFSIILKGENHIKTFILFKFKNIKVITDDIVYVFYFVKKFFFVTRIFFIKRYIDNYSPKFRYRSRVMKW